MHLFDVVLFLHITTVLSAFFLAGTLHSAEYQIRATRTVQELRVVTRPFRLGPLFAPILIVLLGLGMWLVHLSKKTDAVFHLGDGFVVVAIVAIVILLADGPLVMAPHGAKLGKALAEAPDGPVTPELRELACAPHVWMVTHMNTLMVVGVVLNMATKPSTLVCVLDAAGGAVLGLLLGSVLAKRALVPA